MVNKKSALAPLHGMLWATGPIFIATAFFSTTTWMRVVCVLMVFLMAIFYAYAFFYFKIKDPKRI